MQLVIENVAPNGPALAVVFDGRSYPVRRRRIEDGGMTEIYELEEALVLTHEEIEVYFERDPGDVDPVRDDLVARALEVQGTVAALGAFDALDALGALVTLGADG